MNELSNLVFETIDQHFSSSRARTVATCAEQLASDILDRFQLTPRRRKPVAYPPEISLAAGRAAQAVLDAYLFAAESIPNARPQQAIENETDTKDS